MEEAKTIWPEAHTVRELRREIARARKRFPANEKLLAALMEEVGELAQAMLQRKSESEIKREALQVACVAIRLYEEGDSDFDAETWDPS